MGYLEERRKEPFSAFLSIHAVNLTIMLYHGLKRPIMGEEIICLGKGNGENQNAIGKGNIIVVAEKNLKRYFEEK